MDFSTHSNGQPDQSINSEKTACTDSRRTRTSSPHVVCTSDQGVAIARLGGPVDISRNVSVYRRRRVAG